MTGKAKTYVLKLCPSILRPNYLSQASRNKGITAEDIGVWYHDSDLNDNIRICMLSNRICCMRVVRKINGLNENYQRENSSYT